VRLRLALRRGQQILDRERDDPRVREMGEIRRWARSGDGRDPEIE
jgi:hypothetical protein